MPDSIQFETPENVQVSYEPAGLGTRFLAWLVDIILLGLAALVIFVVLLCAGIGSDTVLGLPRGHRRSSPDDLDGGALLYFLGLFFLIQGLGSLVYFVAFELWRKGQTIGKRFLGVRVVKLDGFSLDATSILIRNVFRILDHLPLLWIVPVVSAKSQRFGDMVANTIVVIDKPAEFVELRDQLAARAPADAKFSFDRATLHNARATDVEAIEALLMRWTGLPATYQRALLAQIVEALAKRLKVPCPEPDDRLRFLEDFLAAEYRRQHRGLG